MAKFEFEEEVQRVLFALEMNSNTPFEVTVSPNLPATFTTIIQGEGFQFHLHSSLSGHSSILVLEMTDDIKRRKKMVV